MAETAQKYKIIELLYNYFTSIEQMTTGIIRKNSSFKISCKLQTYQGADCAGCRKRM